MLHEMNASLDFLRGKYGAADGKIVLNDGYFFVETPDGKKTPLLSPRVERRFVELKKIIDGKTIEDVSTFRFARFESGGNLADLLAEELDLAAFLSGGNIVRLFASGVENKVCNVIFRLDNGMSGCVECSVRLPAGCEGEDRHEIIARRGVATDRVVDTQVPQASIYSKTASGIRTFTDVDTELFGLPNREIWAVRAAFAVLSNPELAALWNAAFRVSRKLAESALESVKTGKVITF